MDRVDKQYYSKDKPFTEVSATFFGKRMNPRDLKCYLTLSSFSKKLGLQYPQYVIEKRFSSYGNYLRYSFRTILDETKSNNIKTICNELIRYGIKNNSIPMIEFIHYGEQTTVYTLGDYLQSKKIKLKELNIEELSENLEEVRE